MGVCSRSQAQKHIAAGRVEVNGRVVCDPERPTDPTRETIRVDGQPILQAAFVYVMLNKPRGIVVSAADERGRDTVYALLDGAQLPWLGPVGRLDKASEGLLLLSNDSAWAARITAPTRHVNKTYHVQVRGQPDADVFERMRHGVEDAGEKLAARAVCCLRGGDRQTWLEVVLDEGRNRHIRRMLAALGFPVTRLLRTAIGELELGPLAKGQWRHLQAQEVRSLAAPSAASD